jgi:hypothetical protein
MKHFAVENIVVKWDVKINWTERQLLKMKEVSVCGMNDGEAENGIGKMEGTKGACHIKRVQRNEEDFAQGSLG